MALDVLKNLLMEASEFYNAFKSNITQFNKGRLDVILNKLSSLIRNKGQQTKAQSEEEYLEEQAKMQLHALEEIFKTISEDTSKFNPAFLQNMFDKL